MLQHLQEMQQPRSSRFTTKSPCIHCSASTGTQTQQRSEQTAVRSDCLPVQSCVRVLAETREKLLWSCRWVLQVSALSNLNMTVCMCNHLTDFASGFVVPMNSINFENSAFTKLNENPLVFSVMVSCMCLYLVLLIWAKRKDKRDEFMVSRTFAVSLELIKSNHLFNTDSFLLCFDLRPEQHHCPAMIPGINICTSWWCTLAPGTMQVSEAIQQEGSSTTLCGCWRQQHQFEDVM